MLSSQILLLLGTIIAALILFSWGRISVDVVGLGILLFLILTGLLPPAEAFAGFGSDAVLMMLGLLIMVAALVQSGATDFVGRSIVRLGGTGINRLLLMVMGASVTLSAFLSNTASAALLLPITVGLADRAEMSRAKLLMPLAFAAILGSSITLIGTSTNVVASSLMAQHGMRPIGMFELAPVGLPVATVGLLYVLTLGRRLIPDRVPSKEEDTFGMRSYLTEVLVLSDSSLVGKTLSESKLGRDLDLTVLRIDRDEDRLVVPGAMTRLREGDVLLVKGQRKNVLRVKDEAGIDIRAEVEFSLPELQTDDMGLVEVIVLPGSSLVGRTLKGLRFRDWYGLQVLGINRRGKTLTQKMANVRLRVGDVLLVQGERGRIAAIERRGAFQVLSSLELQANNMGRALLSIGIFAGSLTLATFGLVTLPVAALLGAMATFVTRITTSEEVYHHVEWKVLILIASMLSLGTAMASTGTAAFLARQIVTLGGRSQPVWLLTGFFFLTMFLTLPMSNQAAAAVILPVAVTTANQLGLNPRSFAMMVVLAASCSFLTPLEPACLLVYGPGHYRFVDFLKVGALLTALIYVICILMVPLVWPLGAT